MSNASEIEDRVAIHDLVMDYARAMDSADLDAFARLFMADGSLVVKAYGREAPMGVFRGPGRERGVALIAALLNELYDATLHHVTTHTAAIDGDRATGTTYCLAYHVVDDADGSRLETIGVRYDEEFIRTGDGWRMGRREATRLWSQITPTPRIPLLVDRAAGALLSQSRTGGGGGAAAILPR